MISKHFFLRSPGGENEGSDLTAGNNDNDEKTAGAGQPADVTQEKTHKKTVIDKVKDALQDWSNDDRQDQAFDDTRP